MNPAGPSSASAKNMSETKENKNVIDFTLAKLKRLHQDAYTSDEQWIIAHTIDMYQSGTINIQWYHGEPYVIIEETEEAFAM